MAKFNNRELPDLVWESPNGVEGRTVDEFLILSRYAFYLNYARQSIKGGYRLCVYDVDNFYDLSLSRRFSDGAVVPHLIHGNDCYIFYRSGNWAVIDKDCLYKVPKNIRISKHGVLHYGSGLVPVVYDVLGIKRDSCVFAFKDGDNTNLRRVNLKVLINPTSDGVFKLSSNLYKVIMRFDKITKTAYFDSEAKAIEYRNQLEINILNKGMPTEDWYLKE